MKVAKVEKKSIQEVSLSELKAKCLSLLEQVEKTKASIRVTKRGRPIAEIIPVRPISDEQDWLGSMSGTIDFLGDVVSPVIDLDDIEALKS